MPDYDSPPRGSSRRRAEEHGRAIAFGKRGAAKTPRAPNKRQGRRKTIRGATEVAESKERGGGKTDFDPRFYGFVAFKKSIADALPSSLPSATSAAPGLSPWRLLAALGVLAAAPASPALALKSTRAIACSRFDPLSRVLAGEGRGGGLRFSLKRPPTPTLPPRTGGGGRTNMQLP